MKFTLNDKAVTYDGDADKPLLWAIREDMGLTGTKYGCGVAACGACTVHIDGAPARACATPISAVEGLKVVTIEKIGERCVGKAVQAAWAELDVAQCGYCQSGQVMAASALLSTNSAPSDADIDAAMSGNVCRCATYARIRKAVHLAADKLKG